MRHSCAFPAECQLSEAGDVQPIPVVVVTPTITGREQIFAGFRERLEQQTVEPLRHIWISEDPSWGSTEVHVRALVRVRNALLRRASDHFSALVSLDGWSGGYPQWAVMSDDDDVWDPWHLEELWETHLRHPSASLVYALTPPRANRAGATIPNGAMVNEALLDAAAVLRVGGYQYRDGWNEDVLADRLWVLEHGLERVYCSRPSYQWVRGDHEHAIDRYGREEHEAWQAQASKIT